MTSNSVTFVPILYPIVTIVRIVTNYYYPQSIKKKHPSISACRCHTLQSWLTCNAENKRPLLVTVHPFTFRTHKDIRTDWYNTQTPAGIWRTDTQLSSIVLLYLTLSRSQSTPSCNYGLLKSHTTFPCRRVTFCFLGQLKEWACVLCCLNMLKTPIAKPLECSILL